MSRLLGRKRNNETGITEKERSDTGCRILDIGPRSWRGKLLEFWNRPTMEYGLILNDLSLLHFTFWILDFTFNSTASPDFLIPYFPVSYFLFLWQSLSVSPVLGPLSPVNQHFNIRMNAFHNRACFTGILQYRLDFFIDIAQAFGNMKC